MALTEFNDFIPPVGLADPVPAPPALPPQFEPLSKRYQPLADAYRHSGLQDFDAADLDIPNPDYEAARQFAADITPSGSDMGYDSNYEAFLHRNDAHVVTPNPGGHSIIGSLPEGFQKKPLTPEETAKILEPVSRVVGAGQSALDLITIHADKLIPGPGQRTLGNRFDQLVAAGANPDAAAHQVMDEYGQALGQFAEDPNQNIVARGIAQGARVVGTAQSLTAPSPTPGGLTAPIALGAVKASAKKALGNLTADEVKRLADELPAASAALTAAAKAGDQAAIDAAVAHLRDLKIPENIISDSIKRAIRDTAAGTARTLGKSEDEIANVAKAANQRGEAQAASQTGVQNTQPPVNPKGGLTQQGTQMVRGQGVKAAKVPNQGTGAGLNQRIKNAPPKPAPAAAAPGPGAAAPAGAPPAGGGAAGGGAGAAAGGAAPKGPPKTTVIGQDAIDIMNKAEGVVNAVSAPKSALSSGDVSLSGRQFFAFALSHPKEWAKGLAAGVGAYKDPNAAFAEADRLKTRISDLLDSYGLRADELEIPTKASGGLGSSTNFAAAPFFVRGKYNPLKYTMGPILERSEAAAAVTAATIRGNVFDNEVSNRALNALRGMGYNSTKDTAVKDLAKVMNAGAFQAIVQTRNQMAQMGYAKALGQDQVKELARALNHASGRGYTMPEKGMANYLARTANLVGNVVLFSPQNTVSRARFFADVLGAGKTVAQDLALRRPVDPVDLEKLRLGAGYVGGITTLLSAAAASGLNVNIDPTSTEFLKIDLGEPGAEKGPIAAALSALGLGVQTYNIDGKPHVTIDVTGGGSQLVREIARQVILIPKALTGGLSDLKGTDLAGKTPGGELGQYTRNKMAPTLGAAFDIANNKASVTDERLLTDNPISSLFIFLTLQDAIEAGGFVPQGGTGPQKQNSPAPQIQRGGAGVYPRR